MHQIELPSIIPTYQLNVWTGTLQLLINVASLFSGQLLAQLRMFWSPGLWIGKVERERKMHYEQPPENCRRIIIICYWDHLM